MNINHKKLLLKIILCTIILTVVITGNLWADKLLINNPTVTLKLSNSYPNNGPDKSLYKQNDIDSDTYADLKTETNLEYSDAYADLTTETEPEYSDLYEDEEDGITIADPLYYLNLAVFHFNDKFYIYLLDPVARGYKKIIPEPVRTCTSNFFHNITFPIRFINNILQGEMAIAGGELVAFTVNSTAGCLGLVNMAKNIPDLKLSKEDFGQTLGKYGIGNGFFIELPFLGPSTLRDTVGLAGDIFLYPVSYVKPVTLAYGIQSVDFINRASFRTGEYQLLKDAAISPYEAFRAAYIQYRIALINK